MILKAKLKLGTRSTPNNGRCLQNVKVKLGGGLTFEVGLLSRSVLLENLIAINANSSKRGVINEVLVFARILLF